MSNNSITGDRFDAKIDDRLELKFSDYKPALDKVEAITEANRCINCYDAPCISACPTGINIPRYISRIASQDFKGSAKTILDSNIFGLSCASSCPTEVLCEGACVYHALNKKPIQIGKLQRFAVEYAYDQNIKFYKPGPATGKRVALIGAGLASLACAHELRLQGHETIIFEKSQLSGGLNTSGIAPYKMKAQTSLREIEFIQSVGIKIEYGQELGKNLSVHDLLKKFDAVFLGMGLGPDSILDTEGLNEPGLYGSKVFGAVDFISKIKLSSGFDYLKNVKTALVVGGGNTALDACRELKWLGVEKVIVSYRRSADSMSGYIHEYNSAKQEGVEFWLNTLPVAFLKNQSTDQKLKVKLQKTKSTQDGKVVFDNESLEIQVDLVLVATGQAKLEKEISSIPGLRFQNGRLIVDSKSGQTGNQKIFAGGDLVNGGMEVVNAVAEGKRAAIAIGATLNG